MLHKTQIDLRKAELDDIERRITELASGRGYSEASSPNPYEHEAEAERLGFGTSKGLKLAAVIRALVGSDGDPREAGASIEKHYGGSHPVTKVANKALTNKALVTGVASSGGYVVPPDTLLELVELLRPATVVRAAGPRIMPMPRGTMTIPVQTSPGSAAYGSETGLILESQPGVGQYVATYKKLRAICRVSNDLIRYSTPAADSLVRDDLIRVLSLAQDAAFLFSDGSADSPRGLTSFANQWAATMGGSAAALNIGQNSTFGTGGNFITSNPAYSVTTMYDELAGAITKLSTANVPNIRRAWFMHPRTFWFLATALNSIALPVFPNLINDGLLWNIPVYQSTQIPITYWDPEGINQDLSVVILAEMSEALLLESSNLEIVVLREGATFDQFGTLHSLGAEDCTGYRAIMRHDFLLRHSAAVSVIQGVRWAPATS